MKSNRKGQLRETIAKAATLLAAAGVTAPPAAVREAVSGWSFLVLEQAMRVESVMISSLLLLWGKSANHLVLLWIELDAAWDRAIETMGEGWQDGSERG